MKTIKTLMAALMVTLFCFNSAKAQNKPATGAMGEGDLKTMLDNLGYDPKDAPLSGNRTGYFITVKFKGQNASMFMQISPSGSNVWSTFDMAELKPEHKDNGARLTKLLQLNQKYGPCHFYIHPNGNMLSLTRCLFNKNITPKELREHIEEVISTATATIDDWNTQTWNAPTTAQK